MGRLRPLVSNQPPSHDAPTAHQGLGPVDAPTNPSGAATGPTSDETRRGRYVLTSVIGQGGMGKVYSAYDPHLQRNVAIKVVRRGRPEDHKRLQREAAVMAQLHHSNVVAVHDVDFADDGVSVVMELVKGPDLMEWLQKEPRSIEAIVDGFLQAGRGLAVAHAAGMVHRDFKPGNVLVAPGDVFKVTDFGLAKPVKPSEQAAERKVPFTIMPAGQKTAVPIAASLTQTGVVMGTTRYMSPQQHMGEPIDARADQFAFCVAMWTALFKVPPYAGNELQLVKAKMAGPPKAPSTAIPLDLVAALQRGMAPQPDGRWPTMDALLEAIEAAMKPTPQQTQTPWIVWGALAVGGFIVLGGVTAWVLARGGDSSDPPDEPSPPAVQEPEESPTPEPPAVAAKPDVAAPEPVDVEPPIEPLMKFASLNASFRADGPGLSYVLELGRDVEGVEGVGIRWVCDSPFGPVARIGSVPIYESTELHRRGQTFERQQSPTFEGMGKLPCTFTFELDAPEGKFEPLEACLDEDGATEGVCDYELNPVDKERSPEQSDAVAIVDGVVVAPVVDRKPLDVATAVRFFEKPPEGHGVEVDVDCEADGRVWTDASTDSLRRKPFGFVAGERYATQEMLFYKATTKFKISQARCDLYVRLGDFDAEEQTLLWHGCVDRGVLSDRPCAESSAKAPKRPPKPSLESPFKPRPSKPKDAPKPEKPKDAPKPDKPTPTGPPETPSDEPLKDPDIGGGSPKAPEVDPAKKPEVDPPKEPPAEAPKGRVVETEL